MLAGKVYGIPVKRTHAHSWVMSFDTRARGLRAYAEAMPNNCVFLVDTYDTLEGVRHAIEVGRMLRARGARAWSGSGSTRAIWPGFPSRPALLDEAGFPDAVIVASNDLDEHLIESLKHQGASHRGLGRGHPAGDGLRRARAGRRLQAVALPARPAGLGAACKVSEQSVKTLAIPACSRCGASARNGQLVADAIFDEVTGCARPPPSSTHCDPLRRRTLSPELTAKTC